MRFQRTTFTCGPAAIVNALRSLGVRVSERRVRAHSATTEEHGTNAHGLRSALERLGFNGVELLGEKEGPAWQQLTDALLSGFPTILLVDRWQHWITAIGSIGDNVIVFDSKRTKKNREENGVHVISRKELFERWHVDDNKFHYGIIVMK
jgi:ABC-type bacteriocin/lantibiotic exporter with double-glycine peptidase domain